MDHSEGIQIPKGVLPQVSSLQPGLAVIFKAPQMDVRMFNDHIQHLNDRLSELYPNFTTANAAGDWEGLESRFKRLRQDAINNNRVCFIAVEPFAPRETMLQALADHTFAYAKCMSQLLFCTLKVNGKVNVTFGHVPMDVIRVLRPPRPKPERTVLQIELPDGVDRDEAERRIDALMKEYKKPDPTLYEVYAHRAGDPDGDLLAHSQYGSPLPSITDMVLEVRHRCLNWREGVWSVSYRVNGATVLETRRTDDETPREFIERHHTAVMAFANAYSINTKPEPSRA